MITVSADPTTRLGFGFAVETGSSKSLPFKAFATEMPTTGAGVAQVANFRLVDTYEESKEFLSLDVAASYGWMTGSVEAKASMLNSAEFSSHTVSIFGRVQLTWAGERLKTDPEFTAAAKKLATSKKTALEFYNRYGSHWVDALGKGGELLILMSVKAKSQQDKQSIKADLNVSAWGGKLDLALSSQIEQRVSSYEKELFISKFGSPAKLLPFSLTEVVNEWRNFPIEAFKNPLVTTAYLRPYGDLTGGGVLAEMLLTEKLDKINYIADLFQAYRRAISELRRSAMEPDIFYPEITSSQAAELLSQCEKEVEKIRQVAKQLADADPASVDVSKIRNVRDVVPDCPFLMRENIQTVGVPATVGDYYNVGLPTEVMKGEYLEFDSPVLPGPVGNKWKLGAQLGWVDADGYQFVTAPGIVTKQPTVRFGRLIGKIGATEFEVGKARAMRAPDSGKLLLMCNDSVNPPSFQDNLGSVTLTIKHRRP